jgi:hypothetical protein
MGGKTELISETVNVNANSVASNAGSNGLHSLSMLEVFAVAVAAVIICVVIGKAVQHYFKRAVRAYAVNV